MRIGLFCTDAADIYQRTLVAAVTRKAVSEGHQLTVVSTHVLTDDPETASLENRMLSLLGCGLFDGLILFADSMFHLLTERQGRTLMEAAGTTPWVSVDKLGWDGPAVTMDNTAALPALIDHLHDDHGYRDYLFLLGPSSSVDGRERAEFFVDYLAAKGAGARWVTLVCDFLEEMAFQKVLAYFQSDPPLVPRVIVASNDNMALGALRALRTLGLNCPADCAVTGFDDVEEAALEDPGLTTVRQPLEDLASRALESLSHSTSPGRPGLEVVPTRLVLRESCGCPSRQGDPKDYRALLSLVQSLRIRGETLLRASASFGVQVIGSLDLETLLSHLRDHCRALAFPDLRLFLVGEEPVPRTGLPATWTEVFRFGDTAGEWRQGTVGLGPVLFPGPEVTDPDLVRTVTLLYTEGRILGVLACVIPGGWMGFLRLLATNLASGLSRVHRWRTLLDHAEDLEVSVAQRNRDLLEVNRALRLENQRRRELEQALSTERQALEEILEGQPIALVVLSAEGRRIRYFNRHFTRMLAFSDSDEIPPSDAFSLTYGDLLAGKAPGGAAEALTELELPTREGGSVPVLVGRTEVVLRGERSILAGMMDLTLQKQLEHDLLNIRENDSRRFGQELHDDVCQKLAALALFTSILDQKLATQTGTRVPEVAELSVLTKGILDHVRALSRGLFPIEVGNMSLAKLFDRLLHQVENQTGLRVRWVTNLGEGSAGLETSQELHLFRIVQEAIQNTIKHAAATRVDVSLVLDQGRLVLDYADDGRGPEHGYSEGLGLRSMRYRASQLGAELTWGPREGGGFSLRLSQALPPKEG